MEPTPSDPAAPPVEPPASSRPAQRPQPGSGGAVYGLGMIGALVWFWRRADSPGGRVLAVGKAIVWPAILVHAAFARLQADRSGG